MHPALEAVLAELRLSMEQRASLLDALRLSEEDAARRASDAVARAPLASPTTVSLRGFASVELSSGADPAPVATRERVPADAWPRIGSRYLDLGPIGEGGMGEVRRVRDLELNRVLAMKIIHAPLVRRGVVLARFLEEAQATAQLQHPNIVPVHDIGRLPDGRLWFVMREIRGRTLSEVIREAHGGSVGGRAAPAGGWSLRRLVAAFHTACQAVAYAHERGVVHRDLKPDNVMLGRLGEVYVIDWGLAKVVGRRDLASEAAESDLVETGRAVDHATQIGQVAGTPAYMPPEQAMGQVDRIDARSDVYALGAVLYEILCGRAPYAGAARQVLEQVRAHPPADLDAEGAALPDELVAACRRAMSREPSDRYATASDLADAVLEWLDGARRREQALRVVADAHAKAAEASAYRQRAAQLAAEAEAMLSGMEPWRPEEDKAPGWGREDAAAALRRQAEVLGIEEEHLLRGALTHAPDLPEAHAALAARYRAEHLAAEETRRNAQLAEVRLRRHAEALPPSHPDRESHVAYLRGHGALSLRTDPPGAEVELHAFELQNRRLVPRWVRALGVTPLEAVPLPMGSYLCVLRHPDRVPVRYPVHIRRGEHWDGVPPERGAPHPIHLPRPSEVEPGECYVPAGWTRIGGDPDSVGGTRAGRVWIDGFVVQRFPVVNADYLAFLNGLVQEGRAADALLYAPRMESAAEGRLGDLLIGYRDGAFSLRSELVDVEWRPDFPMVAVPWDAAVAYARWQSARTGLDWRLIDELRWEKAARGVDGRIYPCGDSFDPSWACLRSSLPGRPFPAAVDSFPVDESVYGVRGCAGNVRDWCLDEFTPGGPVFPATVRVGWPEPSVEASARATQVLRGGGWFCLPEVARMADRYRGERSARKNYIGFRLARPLPPRLA